MHLYYQNVKFINVKLTQSSTSGNIRYIVNRTYIVKPTKNIRFLFVGEALLFISKEPCPC